MGEWMDFVRKTFKSNSNSNSHSISTSSANTDHLVRVQVYTHNIRYANTNLVEGEKPWSTRKQGVINLIKQHTANPLLPTIIGLQEVLIEQLKDIMDGLGPSWKYFGVGRNDGTSRGEFAPVIYNFHDWILLDSKTHWLSTTPDVPSKSWDAALNRIVTVVVLKHHQSGKVVSFYNTHYDHKGKFARAESSFLIERLIRQSGYQNCVLVGDFNCEETDPGYQTLSMCLKESGKSARVVQGERRTCTGFRGNGTGCIDFIWTTPNVAILYHTTVGQYCNGCLCSDHRPVLAVVAI
ncbi:uncharacterized protein LODBEIA_P06460 [Lodderomyces beijingensis]|uniref:Endonuclease/exonuclease/phosphatase domain-containing protein n=1 Tax=Lodderomyces beijingensis TaxID=1775926 RepID=A0ABP0ZJS4_9ASCO